MSYNVGRYSNIIEFETKAYDGVYWVPINTLGKSRYSDEEALKISELSIKERKKHIGNLYEAVQLFQASNFRGILDNKDFWSGNTHWQRHKTPEEAVLSNEGCCATDTNWLAYFIHEIYDQVGSFCYANDDGNGHITTYILHESNYYFIDMMMCRKDSQVYLCNENGMLTDLLNSEWSGFLFKCKNPIDFCYFNIERFKEKKRRAPFCFYMRETSFVQMTGNRIDANKVTFLVPKQEKPAIVYLDDASGNMIEFVDTPNLMR